MWLQSQQEAARHNQAVNHRIDLLRQEIKNLEREVAPDDPARLRTLKQQVLSQIADTETSIRKNKTDMLGVEAQREQLKFWKEGFGPSGIRNLMLDDLRGALAFATKRYLYQLAVDTIQVEFPQAGRTRTSQDKFEVDVTMNGHKQPLHMFSDGEEWRASFAVLLALGDVLRGFSRHRIDLRMIDDPLGDLDDAGVTAFMGCAYDMFASSGTVLVAVPRPVSVDFRARVWTVKKTGEESRVTV